mgnify:CR=1 FL=1
MESLKFCREFLDRHYQYAAGADSAPGGDQALALVECGVRASTSYRPPAPARSTSYRQAVATAQQQRQPCACARTRGEATGQY